MQLVIWPFHAASRQASTTRVLQASSVTSMLGKNSRNRTCTHHKHESQKDGFLVAQQHGSQPGLWVSHTY